MESGTVIILEKIPLLLRYNIVISTIPTLTGWYGTWLISKQPKIHIIFCRTHNYYLGYYVLR